MPPRYPSPMDLTDEDKTPPDLTPPAMPRPPVAPLPNAGSIPPPDPIPPTAPGPIPAPVLDEMTAPSPEPPPAGTPTGIPGVFARPGSSAAVPLHTPAFNMGRVMGQPGPATGRFGPGVPVIGSMSGMGGGQGGSGIEDGLTDDELLKVLVGATRRGG